MIERDEDPPAAGLRALVPLKLNLAALAPPVIHAVIARQLYAPRLFNVMITNDPGMQAPRYAFGAVLRQVYRSCRWTPGIPLASRPSRMTGF